MVLADHLAGVRIGCLNELDDIPQFIVTGLQAAFEYRKIISRQIIQIVSHQRECLIQIWGVWVALFELKSHTLGWVSCRDSQRVELLNKMEHGLNFIHLNLWKVNQQAFMDILQAFGEITSVIHAINDRHANLVVSLGQVCIIQLPQQVFIERIGFFGLILE